MRRLIGLVVAVGLFAVEGRGGERSLAWPQFRGPGGAGVAEGAKPPVNIGPETNVRWKVAAPPGLSSPIVAGDKLVVTAFEGGKLYTIAYGRADGKEAWRREAPAKRIEAYHKTQGSPAASTPATDGARIVSYFGSCGLFCYDVSGKPLWNVEMPTAQTGGDFGSGVSPIIADGVVVLVRDELKGSKIVAVDAVSGWPKWETRRQSPNSYGTPVLWETAAGKQVAAVGHGRMIGYDLKSGSEVWSVAGMPAGCATSPVVAGGTLYFAGWSPGGAGDEAEFALPPYDHMLKQLDKNGDGWIAKAETAKTDMEEFFDNNDTDKDGRITREEWDSVLKFMSEGKNVAFALRPGGAGDVTKSHVIWAKSKGLPYLASGIVYGGQFLMVKDGGFVTAYDAKTGKEVYRQRAAAPGQYYASPVASNGNIYFTSLDGVVTVLKAGADRPVVVAENASLGERVAATPAIADDTLYVRTAGHLYAFAESGGR
jgi:outer membrane protein assembly factor BamB